MYYLNRIDLGGRLSERLTELKGQEAVVLVVKESSTTACIALASQINAWVFPLITERIEIPGDERTIGLLTADGTFVWNPDFSPTECDQITMDSHALIEDAKREAFSRLNQTAIEYGEMSKDGLNGRTLIIAGDIVKDKMEIAAALEYIKPIRYEKLYAVGGNVDAGTADYMHLQSDKDVALDVMTNMFDESHYFDEQVSYTPEECRKLLVNISQYWA